MKENNIIKDTEVYMLAQFIDVLESIENFEKVEDIKINIRERKKAYEKEIKCLLSKSDKNNST